MNAKEINEKVIYRCFANNITSIKKAKLIISIKDLFKPYQKQIESLQEENKKLSNELKQAEILDKSRLDLISKKVEEKDKLKARIKELELEGRLVGGLAKSMAERACYDTDIYDRYLNLINQPPKQSDVVEEREDPKKSIETVGAKIRNRLSPYSHIIALIELGEDDRLLVSLREKVKWHKQMLSELVELSKECEIHPSDKWDKYGG